MGKSLKEKLVINKDYTQYKHFLIKLPDIFQKEGDIVYQDRNTIKSFEMNGIRINVKSFRTPHLINQFVYTLFRDSKAKRSYHYAKNLINRGINTPQPIAYMEFKAGIRLQESFYVSQQIEFDDEMRVLQKGSLEEHKPLILAFAKYTAFLHNQKVLHLDYSPGNILFKKEEDKYGFWLVDLNRMRFDKDVTSKEAAYNFRRLWGSDEMIKVFVKEYASRRNLNTHECLKYTFKYREEFWSTFTAKYPEATPYIP